MTSEAPEPGPARRLVWAPDHVRAPLAEQVRPRVSLPRQVVLVATLALVFAWLPAFAVFAVAAVVAPSATGGAGVGTVALWALQFAALVAVTAAVTTLVRRGARADDTDDTDEPPRRAALRVAADVLRTVACAGLVLALHGLSAGRIAWLTGGLVVVLHVLPATAARLLLRRRGRPVRR